MDKKLENLYNKLDLTDNRELKEYMTGSIIIVKELSNKSVNDFDEEDYWKLEEVQLLSDLINGRSINWVSMRDE